MRDFLRRIALRDPLTGKKRSPPQIKRDRLFENKRDGKGAEELYKCMQGMAGYKVKRTGKGDDFHRYGINPITGERIIISRDEVKASETAPLSKLQRETKRTNPKYRVLRLRRPF